MVFLLIFISDARESVYNTGFNASLCTPVRISNREELYTPKYFLGSKTIK